MIDSCIVRKLCDDRGCYGVGLTAYFFETRQLVEGSLASDPRKGRVVAADKLLSRELQSNSIKTHEHTRKKSEHKANP